MSKIILTGDRPTGRLHVGHYVGSLKERVKLQNSGEYDEIYIMIADAQALTDNAEHPEKVRQNIMNVALDYLACGKLDAEVAAELVSGVAEGCYQAGAALIGGETAEMPGFYKVGDYDIAGFCVGAVEKSKIVNGSTTSEGDILIAIPSSGVHSNGFSLVRKVITDYTKDFNGKPISETLLTPTKIYVKSVLAVLEKYNVKGMAHITGGGLPENLPRTISEGHQPVVFKDKLRVLDIFKYIQKEGEIPENEMFGTFNMGVGFVLVVDPKDKEGVIEELAKHGEEAFEIGYVQKGEKGLCLR